jgi:MFS transporter, putative metabolite transport protein
MDFEDAPLRPFHLRLAAASGGGVFSCGVALGVVGIALGLATPQLQLTPLWIGLLGGASLAGLLFGALAAGPVADRFGRRAIFGYNMAFLAVCSALQFFVVSSVQLLTLRLAIGFVLGTDFVVGKTVVSEFTPRAYRGRMLGVLSIAWAGGFAFGYFVAFALRTVDANAWRWMLLASAVPCLPAFLLRVTIPESPLWLAEHGRADRAAQVVLRIFGTGVMPPGPAPSPSRGQARWRQLFSPTWRRRTLIGLTVYTCQTIPYFAVGTFVAEVINALNLHAGYVGGIFYNLSLLIGAALGLIVVDRISRRGLLVGTFVLSALALLPLAFGVSLSPVVITILFGIYATVLSCAVILDYVYLPELFPTDLRASGIALALAGSRVGSTVGTFLLPVVVADLGPRVAIAACVAVLLIGAVICHVWAPETRNVRLATVDAGATL